MDTFSKAPSLHNRSLHLLLPHFYWNAHLPQRFLQATTPSIHTGVGNGKLFKEIHTLHY